MSSQITVTLPDHVFERAQRLAKLAGRNVEDVLATTLETSLPPFIDEVALGKPVNELSDDEVIALTKLQMKSEQDKRLSVLLKKQREDEINEAERIELAALMRIYEQGLLRKSEGLREAVERGLREPLEP